MTRQERTVLKVVILLLLGVLSNVAMGTISVPDEETHYAVTYHLFGWMDPSIGTIEAGYPKYGYLPAAIGLEIGKAFGFSGTLLHGLARMCNQITFLVLVVFSCKVVPDLGAAVWAIASLPSVVWLTASYSYDGWNLGFSMLFICYLWKLTAHSNIVGIRELVLYAILLVAFAPIKYIYVLLALLIVAIPRSRWNNLKRILIGIVVAMTGLVIAMWSRLQEALSYVLTTGTDTRGLEQGLSGNSYTIFYVLRHPLTVFMTFVRTLFADTEIMIERLLVGEFHSGYVPEYLTIVMAVLFAALMLYSTRQTLVGRIATGHPHWTAWAYRIVLALGVLAVYVSFMFLYSYYKDGQIGVISGVQGRYFLPWVLLLAPAGPARLSIRCCDWLSRHMLTEEQLWTALVYVGMLTTLCRMTGFI